MSQISHNKKQGVSGQSLAVSRDVKITKHNKDFRSRTVIKEAIMENDFLKNLSQGQVSPGGVIQVIMSWCATKLGVGP